MGKVISIWSDGSSHNNGEKKGIGGWGAVMIYGELPDEVDKLHGKYGEDETTLEIYGGYERTTNQQMEIHSIIESLKRLKKSTGEPIHVFSDSAYVINCMNDKWWHGWKTNGWKNSKKQPVANREFWEELLQLIEDGFLDITWNKIKGHKGIYYNEVADVLAGRGTKEVEERKGF